MTTSSFCNFGDCVEVQVNSRGLVVVSNTATGFELSFTTHEWVAFLRGVKAGEFDLEVLRGDQR